MDNSIQARVEKGYKSPWLRVKAVAEYVGVSQSTIWAWARNGFIKSHKIGSGTTLFNIHEIDEFLNKGVKNDKNA